MGKHEGKHKKSKKKSKKHKKERRRSSSSSSTSSDDWVEKKTSPTVKPTNEQNLEPERDEWMSLPTLFSTSSNNDRRKERKETKEKEKIASTYDPSKSSRELNPYWKSGGDGLPTLIQKAKFMKPNVEEESSYKSSYNKAPYSRSSWRKSSPKSFKQESESSDRRNDSSSTHKSEYNYSSGSRGSWRKKSPDLPDKRKEENSPKSSSSWNRKSPERTVKVKYDASTSDYIYTNTDSSPEPQPNKNETQSNSSETLTEKEMNEIAAKIIKAEILGNTDKIIELKEKLNRAREAKLNAPVDANKEESVLLFRTDAKGFSEPLDAPVAEDYNKRKKKAETHDSGKRQKYYADDDKYNLKQMFEQERFNTTTQQDAEFVKLTAKASKMDDLDDIFMDKIRNEKPSDKTFKKERDKAIKEHQKISDSLDNCQQCLQSASMPKYLMVSLGETVYLSLPAYEPLTEGHCLLIPTRHVSCSTQLDENEWSEILDFRKSLTKMFSSQDNDLIFYETVLNAHSYSHMVMHCVPVPKEQGDVAPIYFKKAIDECETEWSTNKKLINLAGKDVRRAVPKGLPYFFVSFGMNEGFAHVIEDQRYFSKFFAAEIIGGILDLNHSKWRKQHNEKFDVQKSRVLQFTNMWQRFDCTIKN